MATKLEVQWAEYIRGLSVTPPAAYIQIRKMFTNLQFTVSWEDFDGISLGFENMGYSKGPSKMNQLKRNYLNEEELIKARESFRSRLKKSQSCITARFGNKEKDSRSQGFCMQTITINYLEKPEPGTPGYVIELYYRSTELGQKFLADLKFLSEVVFPILVTDDMPQPDLVRFKFSCAYLSTMFLPVVFQRIDVLEFMEGIRDHDPKWFTGSARSAVSKWMVEECGYNYRTRAKMHEVFREYVYGNIPANQKSKLKRILKR